MDEIILKIAEITPVVGILIWVVLYFKGELKSKNDEITSLNTYIRNLDKETLQSMNRLADAVDSLKDLIKSK